MLFPQRLHDGLRSGEVTVAFRNWTSPTVRTGGTLQSPGGLLQIDVVEPIDPSAITAQDALAAGHADIDDVIATLRPGDDRRLYRIRFHRLGDDPRIALRNDDDLDDDDVRDLDARLDRWDRASTSGPWTADVLEVIRRHPGRRSADLVPMLDVDQPLLKRRVRQLKGLGLTESLEVGYRLSPRGAAFVERSGRT